VILTHANSCRPLSSMLPRPQRDWWQTKLSDFAKRFAHKSGNTAFLWKLMQNSTSPDIGCPEGSQSVSLHKPSISLYCNVYDPSRRTCSSSVLPSPSSSSTQGITWPKWILFLEVFTFFYPSHFANNHNVLRFFRTQVFAPEKLAGNLSIASALGLFAGGIVVFRTWGDLMVPAWRWGSLSSLLEISHFLIV